MFALGFWFEDDEETGEEEGYTVEFETSDFEEAIENLQAAREDSEAGLDLWDGAKLLVGVLLDSGEIEYQPLEEKELQQ